MPRVRIIYDVEGWAYHNRALALQKYAPPEFDVSLAALGQPADVERALGDAPVDLVLFLPESPTAAVAQALRARDWQAKLVCGWSVGWPRRLELFYANYDIADALIINNRFGWEGTGRLPRTRMLANGVDLDVFRVTTPIEQRAPRVLWTGSELWRSVKGYDQYIRPLMERLRARGIACETRLVESRGEEKLRPAAMAEWYNAGTVVVCASEAEGTPNPALEAAACGCTVVSTRVGNMPELIRDGENGFLVDRDVADIAAKLRRLRDDPALRARMGRAARAAIEPWDWRWQAAHYDALFRAVLGVGAGAG